MQSYLIAYSWAAYGCTGQSNYIIRARSRQQALDRFWRAVSRDFPRYQISLKGEE